MATERLIEMPELEQAAESVPLVEVLGSEQLVETVPVVGMPDIQ